MKPNPHHGHDIIPQAHLRCCQGGHKVHLLLGLVLTTTTFVAGATVPKSMIANPCGGANHLAAAALERRAGGNAQLRADSARSRCTASPAAFITGSSTISPPAFAASTRDAQFAASKPDVNGTGSAGYYGPCPPPGKLHHYNFTLYALATPIELDPGAPLDEAALARTHARENSRADDADRNARTVV